jgi:CheY-like chemotaxis protein
MFGWFETKVNWPELNIEDIKKRARILIIDDKEFNYTKLFQKDGYNCDKWDDVTDLNKLENGYFDVVFLDIQGVGKEYSKDEGLGVLRHIKTANPVQIVIVYSDAGYSLKYQELFQLADMTLDKGSDYSDFKRPLDQALLNRFRLGFYVEKALAAIPDSIRNESTERRTRDAVTKSIAKGNISTMTNKLKSVVDNDKALNLIVRITELAIVVAKGLTVTPIK